MRSEAVAGFFFVENVKPLVSAFVFEVDGVGVQLEEAPTSYGAKPDDSIWGRRVHVEFKSARALLHHHVPEIFAIGSANDRKGSELVLWTIYHFPSHIMVSTATQRPVRLVQAWPQGA
jgi:hypothetical protein